MAEPAIVQLARIIFLSRGGPPLRRAPSQSYHWPMRRGWALSLTILVTAALVPALVSCAPPAISGGFDSPHPAARLFATRRAAAENDPAQLRASIPGLIRNLESDDPAVRLLSAEALDELTGETFGYRHYDPEWMRTPAVRQWRDAWERGELTLRDGTRIGPDTLETKAVNERTAIGR